MSNWTQLRLILLPEHADLAAQLLLDAGCEGVQIEDSTVRFDESEDATIEPRELATVTGYLNGIENTAAVREQVEQGLKLAEIAAEITIEPIADADWTTSWRENFPPLHIGPFTILPPWNPTPVEDSIAILIDPGLAFGTGQHPTTRMCLELLGERLQPGATVLDVGCGSGILSIAAAKLGAQVTASDLDTFCVEATQENTAANGVEVEVVQQPGAAWTNEKYDVVVANLMSALLIQLAGELAGAAKPGGLLIVSGISLPRADEVEAALNGAGFSTQEKRVQDGDQRGDYVEQWAAFVLRARL